MGKRELVALLCVHGVLRLLLVCGSSSRCLALSEVCDCDIS